MTHTFIVYHDENGKQIDEPINNEYGASAFVGGVEIYSTDGNPVDLKAPAHNGMTVEEIVKWHQQQPEIRNENISAVLLWFVGIPAIIIVLARIILYVLDIVLNVVK